IPAAVPLLPKTVDVLDSAASILGTTMSIQVEAPPVSLAVDIQAPPEGSPTHAPPLVITANSVLAASPSVGQPASPDAHLPGGLASFVPVSASAAMPNSAAHNKSPEPNPDLSTAET